MKTTITYQQMIDRMAANGVLRDRILKALKKAGKLPK
jgi:hypothetical protein